MWLLELHLVISVLCIITFIGFAKAYKEKIKENGWLSDGKKEVTISKHVAFFVPLMNILLVMVVFMMIVMKKEDFENMSR